MAMPGFCKPKEKQTLEEGFLQSSVSCHHGEEEICALGNLILEK
jgi:hypothetical protein